MTPLELAAWAGVGGFIGSLAGVLAGAWCCALLARRAPVVEPESHEGGD